MSAPALTESDIAEIIVAFEAGTTRIALATAYGVHPNTITRVLGSCAHLIRRARKHRLSDSEEAAVAAAYVAGETTTSIAERFGVPPQHVTRTAVARGAGLRQHGNPGRTPSLSDLAIHTVVREYGQGASLRDLAARHRVSTATIVRALEREGVARRPRHRTTP